MNQQRGHLPLILCAVLAVSGGYASTIQAPTMRHASAFYDTAALQTPSSIDNWLGGFGNWSDPGQWDAGVPGSDSDVVIYSGSSDYVFLDISDNIASLTLGGMSGGSSLELDGRNLLRIAGALTINQTGTIYLFGGAVAVFGDVASNGTIVDPTQGSGSQLNIDGTFTNNGSIQLHGDGATVGNFANNNYISAIGSSLTVNDRFTNSGTVFLTGNSKLSADTVFNYGTISLGTSPFGGNGSVRVDSQFWNSGSVHLDSGSLLWITNGDLINQGSVALDTSSLIVFGGVNNSGTISTLPSEFGGSTLSIAGVLTNNGSFLLDGSFGIGDNATIGFIVNNNGGTIDLENSSTLKVNNDVTNYATISTSTNASGPLGGNGITILGTLNNTGSFTLNGDSANGVKGDSTAMGNLLNSGMIDLENASTLTVRGDATNSGTISTSTNSSLGGDHIIIGGALNNTGSFTLNDGSWFLNKSDSATIGSIVNSGAINAVYASSIGAGSIINSGSIEVGSFSDLHVTGDVKNSGGISILGDAPSLEIKGTLTNAGSLTVGGPGGGTARIGNIVNGGSININGLHAGLVVLGALTNSGGIDVTSINSLSASSVNNSGTIDISGPAFIFHEGSSLDITGRLTNGPGGMFSFTGNGTGPSRGSIGSVVNQGTVSMGGGDTILTVTGGPTATGSALAGFTNTGIVNISQGGTLTTPSNYVQTTGQTTVDGNLTVTGRGMINFAGGSLYGNQGVISGPIISNTAINIGDSLKTVGQLAFMGNYTQGSRGSLTFDIAGADPGQYDQLIINGRAQLDGLMTVDLLNSFVPQLGASFDIMDFSSRSGMFSLVLGLPINDQEHFQLEYNSTNLMLEVVAGALSDADLGSSAWFASTAADNNGVTLIAAAIAPQNIASKNDAPSSTPEPSSFLLLGSGLLCLGYAIRRRMRK